MYFFVYGTLKQGYGNNHLLRGSKFIDSGVTLKPYTMFDTGGFPVVMATEKKNRIAGEVYEVFSMQTRASLDRLEGYPHMYHRKKVLVELDVTGHKVACQMYAGTPECWDRRLRGMYELGPGNNGVAVWQPKQHTWDNQ